METTELLARLPGRVRNALVTLRAAGEEAYLVGGAVRDLLLGRPVRDFDLATGATAERLAELFPRATPHGPFGTISLDDDLELTRFRADGPYHDGRHPSAVRFGVSLVEDLARRDFTVNAIAFGYGRKGDAVFVDPAKGRVDLAAKRLRAVGDPVERFSEDALRILRGYRIAAALGFSIERSTRSAMRDHGASLAGISSARVGIEVVRALRSAEPRAFIELLGADGLLEQVLPGLSPAEPTLTAVAKLPGHDPELRLAALFVGVDASVRSRVLDRIDVSREERRRIAGLTDPLPTKLTPAAARDRVARIGREEATRLVRLLRAFPGGTAPAKTLEGVCTDKSAIGRAELAIPAHELAELAGVDGPELGDLLRALVAVIHADPALNDPRQLRNIVRTLRSIPGA
jgi:tRNA nucleotidyltransferase (CCA-adding enzyme)